MKKNDAYSQSQMTLCGQLTPLLRLPPITMGPKKFLNHIQIHFTKLLQQALQLRGFGFLEKTCKV